MNPTLNLAQTLLADPDQGIGSAARTRACAHLARQGLEGELRLFWQRFQPGMETVSLRAQLVCLPVFFRPDPELARLVGYVWGRLSDACHAGVYEAGVGRGEIGRWVEVVGRFCQLNAEIRSSSREERSN